MTLPRSGDSLVSLGLLQTPRIEHRDNADRGRRTRVSDDDRAGATERGDQWSVLGGDRVDSAVGPRVTGEMHGLPVRSLPVAIASQLKISGIMLFLRCCVVTGTFRDPDPII